MMFILVKITGVDESKLKPPEMFVGSYQNDPGIKNWLDNYEEAYKLDELTVASILGYEEVVEKLIDMGYGVKSKNSLKLLKSPLYYALYARQLITIKYLVEIGCKINW